VNQDTVKKIMWLYEVLSFFIGSIMTLVGKLKSGEIKPEDVNSRAIIAQLEALPDLPE